jgi:hypothetical protein
VLLVLQATSDTSSVDFPAAAVESPAQANPVVAAEKDAQYLKAETGIF